MAIMASWACTLVVFLASARCLATYDDFRREQNEIEFERIIKELFTHHEDDCFPENEVTQYLHDVNIELAARLYELEQWGWVLLTNITDYNEHQYSLAQNNYLSWAREQQEQAADYYNAYQDCDESGLTDDDERMLMLLSKSTVTPVPKDDILLSKYTELSTSLESDYGKATVDGLTLEPDLSDIMSSSHNYDELLYVWKGWRDALSSMKGNYTEYIWLANIGAREFGYDDLSDNWVFTDFEQNCTDLEEMADNIWEQAKPLYKQLQRYVNNKLNAEYVNIPDRLRDAYAGATHLMPDSSTIPAHLLGNMWGQEWNNILDDVLPEPSKTSYDPTNELLRQNYTARDLFMLAEEFFTSLGMDPMVPKFWNYSMLVKPSGVDVVCHGSAHNFQTGDDFRIKMCTEVTGGYLKTAHHEMGHIEYYMLYNDLPTVFREGANAAFHEAVGDTIALSVYSPTHQKSISLLDETLEEGSDLNYLMKIALEKVAFLPFGLMLDKWRWGVFNGSISPEKYNAHWWQLRCDYQGLTPPVPRSEEDFDPIAKYHVAANVPYMRYFISFVLQFQFFESLCEEAGLLEGDAKLHECDIYGNIPAGLKLMEALALGKSKPWPDVLEQLTGTRKVNATSLLKYFQPLMDWLQTQNSNEELGWTCPDYLQEVNFPTLNDLT